ncbi:hypothetical protein V5O48_005598 [Marasmius crinis-equi]|uniref:Uncharacterized protein n=1 Tax=Marasmius crinis-equi TaxID=585013 RepID=A0ABR3FM83_9AGAR
MAPKQEPRSDNLLTKAELDAKAMPPPPVPAPQMTILEPEMNALSGCLKVLLASNSVDFIFSLYQNAAVKSGQIFRFYSDAQQLKIRKHVSAPPLSLQASLGRELELYDQICESIESHLLRAISVLQRDLQQEQKRIKEAEAAAMASKVQPETSSPMTTDDPLPTTADELASETTQSAESASNPSQSPSVPVGRRPSAISISSLHRPALPPKLDLSATSLRLTGEETAFLSSGLHSPVTLAPRSARPTDYIGLMATFTSTADNPVDIDLTLPDSDASNNIDMSLDQSLGNTADKPIELDMEAIDGMDIAMTDLFGDGQKSGSTDNVEGLFSPIEGPNEGTGNMNKADASFLSSLGVSTGSTNGEEDLFSSLQSAPEQSTERNGESLSIPPTNADAAPSPGTLIASLSENPVGPAPSTENANGGQPFEFEFFTQDSSLGNFWDIGGTGDQAQGIVNSTNSNLNTDTKTS